MDVGTGELSEDCGEKMECSLTMAPRGCPKSSRFWKNTQFSRFSAIHKDKALHSSWKRKQMDRDIALKVKSLEKNIQSDRRKKIEERKQRRIEQQKKKEENERKAEVVQVIKNPRKLKRLKKKQLRKIEKRSIPS